MRLILLLSMLLLMKLLPLSASAYITGKELLPYCKALINSDNTTDNHNSFISGQCLGYLQNISDLNEMRETIKGAEKRWCPPVMVYGDQLGLIVIKYLEKYPEKLHQPATTLVVEALLDAFPCK